MDSITQLVLGASVGYAIGGKTYRKKALYLGALAGLIPDLDSLFLGVYNDPYVSFVAHRGVTHSIIFCIVAAPLIAYIFKKIGSKIRFQVLTQIFFWGFLTHALLDCFTTWGTQLLWPSPKKIAWNTIFIIDPLYSIPLCIGCAGIFILKSEKTKHKAVLLGLCLSTLYLGWTGIAKAIIHTRIPQAYTEQSINAIRYMSRPTPFNTLIWSTTIETDTQFHHAHLSLLHNTQTPFHTVPKHPLPKSWQTHPYVKQLAKITNGFYTIDPKSDNNNILINDLRYGTLALNPNTPPVFSYILTKKNNTTTFTVKRSTTKHPWQSLKHLYKWGI